MKILHFVLIIVIVTIFYGCRGKEGIEGKKSLIDLLNEPIGTNCPTGGYKIVSGIDINNNNILDVNEIQSTKYICNGINGNNSLAALIPEPAGANCTTGGYKINTGVDINNNNVLDANEVLNSQYLCNGLTGSNSLVALNPEPIGTNCSNGGYKLNTGVDLNKNGTLDGAEIQNTRYICNGNDGLNYLIAVKAESPGSNCIYGGYSFSTGIDANKNGLLDKNEVSAVEYICNNAPLNEIRIPLDFSANTTNTAGVTGLALSNFNKANYPGLDSIVLSARLYTSNADNNSIVDLVNMTDNQIIDDSRLLSNKSFDQSSFIFSKNIFNALPNKAINIGLRLRSEKQGSFAAVYGTSYLILYPKK